MQLRHSLRFRILFSYLIFGISIGGLMGLTHYYSLSELEEILVYEHVEDELHYFIELTDNDQNINLLRTKKFTAFKVKNGKYIKEYPFLEKLSLGQHVIVYDKHTYTVAIDKNNTHTYYVIYDETDFENREKFYLIVLFFSIVFAILFSLWFGYWISGKILSPIARLANQVGNLQAKELTIKLANEYANDEVGQLAKSFEDYMYKLALYVERERSFTADASHELRTPLAVIQGAVEIMLATGSLSSQDIKRVKRIERASRDMSQNLTALLTLAREPLANEFEGKVDLSQIINDVIKSNQESFSSDIKLNLDIEALTVVNAPANIVSVLVSNIIRNAFLYTDKGTVNIQLKNDKLLISDTGVGIPNKELLRVFEKGYRASNAIGDGSGLGLSLSKRICDYYKWTISISENANAGTTVTLKFK